MHHGLRADLRSWRSFTTEKAVIETVVVLPVVANRPLSRGGIIHQLV